MQKKIAVFALAASLLALTACGSTNSSVASSVAPSVTSSATSSKETTSVTSASKETSVPTTSEPTTSEPTTSEPTTSEPTTSEPTTSEPTTSVAPSSSEAPKTGIQAITASGDYDIKAVITAVTTKGFVLDDGTGALYVYTVLDSAYKLGDFVAANVTVAPYFSIWEGTKVNSIAKAEGTAPAIADETVLTGAVAESWKNLGGAKDETTAPTATSNVIPLSLTATAKLDGTFVYFNVEGSDLKIEPSGLSADFTLYEGVEYALNFYFGGYNSSKTFASIYVYAATPNYVAPTGVTVSGSAEVSVGAKAQLAAVVAPTGANPLVTWASADEKIASVDAKGVVTGVAEGSVKITAASVADPTKIGEYSVTVKAAVATKSLVTYDLSKIPNAPTTKPYGALDAAGVLAIFKDATYVAAGANVITSVETATAAYQGSTSQGPSITGLKLGASSTAGVLAFTVSANVVEVKMVVRAWGSTKLASVSVNTAAAVALVAADATTARTLDFTITAGTSVTINTTKYCVITSLELIGE
jgi:hypothetical protein